MADKWLSRNFNSQVQDILVHSEEFHDKYYSSARFMGPCLHFHRRSLAAADWFEKIEFTYATLASWGMHRMGSNGSKMQSFESFKTSIQDIITEVEDIKNLAPKNIDGSGWQKLEMIFKNINVMASGTSLVGNSKVLAHLLPNLVPPIDREYTLSFLFGSKMFQNNKDNEWLFMKKILKDFFYPIASDSTFQHNSMVWMKDSIAFQWDTSVLKIIDNLVIGAKLARETSEGQD